jgi:hypothetical protein
MTVYYCRIRSLKLKDLEKIDTRIVGSNDPDWRHIASEFRNNLKNNIDRELSTIVHDYPVFDGYKLTEVPISVETNAILFSNDSNTLRDYISYKIDFFNRNWDRVSSITIESLHVRNMFLIPSPTGAISLDYCVNDEPWREHNYGLGFDCLQCVSFSDSE